MEVKEEEKDSNNQAVSSEPRRYLSIRFPLTYDLGMFESSLDPVMRGQFFRDFDLALTGVVLSENSLYPHIHKNKRVIQYLENIRPYSALTTRKYLFDINRLIQSKIYVSGISLLIIAYAGIASVATVLRIIDEFIDLVSAGNKDLLQAEANFSQDSLSYAIKSNCWKLLCSCCCC